MWVFGILLIIAAVIAGVGIKMKPTESWKKFCKQTLWAYLIYIPLGLLVVLQAVVFSIAWVVTL